jgi:subtilisin-like proprotein convertase family protein
MRRADGMLTGPGEGDPADRILAYVREHRDIFGLDADDLRSLRLTARATSPDGITTVRWVQTVGGIASYDTGIVGHVAPDGRIIAVSGSAKPDLALADTTPRLSAGEAYAAGAADARGSLLAPRARTARGAERRTEFSDGGHARLAVFATPDGARLVWRVTTTGAGGAAYEQAVDADTGKILHRRPLTSHATNAEFYPRHPGAPAGPNGGGDPVDIDLDADPTWLDDRGANERLRGNNVHVYNDRNADNVADAGEEVPATPDGDWDFGPLDVSFSFPPCPPGGCTWDSRDTSTLATNESHAATNVFVHVNRFHDHLLAPPIGFDEASGNFQAHNASGQGLGGDRVLAENNDGGGTDNANMSTPPDGQSPRMQLYPYTTRSVVSGHDAEIIYHEYTHGLSHRLVVDPAGATTIYSQQARAMGEGWSDWYALDYLVAAGYAQEDPDVVGDLSIATYVSADGTGIRGQAIDCRVGENTGRCAYRGGAWTYQDIRGAFGEHEAGEMWSQTLWDLRRELGPVTARRLITDGMRISAPDPTYVDMRDAIIQADLATGGAHYATLWRVFAARGLGASASSSTRNRSSATEAFDLPNVSIGGTPEIRDTTGDRDGVAEPGETVVLRQPLRNTTVGPVPPFSATLAGGANVTVLDPTAGFAAAPLFGTAAPERLPTFTVDPGTVCGAPLGLRLTATTSAGTTELAVPAYTGTRTRTGADTGSGPAAPVGIPDWSADGVTTTVEIPGPGVPISKLEVTIDDLRHTWVGDLTITLTHDGVTRELLNAPGGGGNGGDNLIGTVLADDAPRSIQVVSADEAPFTGRFRPAESLDAFDGHSTAGTWTLKIVDNSPTDLGTLRRWSLSSIRFGGCEDNSARAVTGDVAAVGPSSATVTGTIDPNGAGTAWRVAYGTTPSYGQATPAQQAGAGRGAVTRSATLTGLAPSTTYHYRFEALRFDEVAHAGADRTFTTGPAGEAPAPAPPEASPAPAAATRATRRPALTLRLQRRTLRLRRGRLTLAFTTRPRATGTLRLRTAARIREGRRRVRLTLGTARFRADARGRATVRIALGPRARRALRRAKGRLRAVATITVAGSSARAQLTVRG